MRFGISATSLMCPKNLRTRLRPVNVCCAIVASHFVARFGRAVQDAAAAAPRVEFFEPVLGTRSPVSGRHALNLFFRPSKRKTTRGAHGHARPSQRSFSRTAKARNSLLSQRLTGKIPHPCPPRFRAAEPIWGDNSADSRGKPSNPHTFSCSACVGTFRRTPFASGPSFRGRTKIPGSADARPGPRASKRCLLELDLRASLLELDLQLLGLVLVHAFLDRLRRALDEVLCFLQAQA